MKKVKHGDKFFIINNEGFLFKNNPSVIEQTGEKEKYIQYQWVIPMYVYSINKIWNGNENFDLCPVDTKTLKNNKNGWKWRRSFEYDEIGKTIFYTEEECWTSFNQRYSEEQRKVFTELRQYRFLQTNDLSFA